MSLWLLTALICVKGRYILAKIKATIANQSQQKENVPMAEEYPLRAPVIDAGRQLPALDSRAAIWPILPSFQQCMTSRHDI